MILLVHSLNCIEIFSIKIKFENINDLIIKSKVTNLIHIEKIKKIVFEGFKNDKFNIFKNLFYKEKNYLFVFDSFGNYHYLNLNELFEENSKKFNTDQEENLII